MDVIRRYKCYKLPYLFIRDISIMPTLGMLGVHPDVCNRLVTKPKFAVNTGSATSQYHRPSPKDILICPLDSIHMLDKSLTYAIPVPLAQAARLKRYIADALACYSDSDDTNTENDEYSLEDETNKHRTPARKIVEAKHRRPYSSRILSVNQRIQQQKEPMSFFRSRSFTICSNLDQLLIVNETSSPVDKISLPIGRSVVGRADSSGGGIPLGYVTHITGSPESGKTQLVCALCAGNHPHIDTAWLLCSGPVQPHAKRMAQFVQSHHNPSLPSPASKEEQNEILQRTVLGQFLCEFDLLAALNDVEQVMQQKQEQQRRIPASTRGRQNSDQHHADDFLIIIDSLGPWNFESAIDQRIAKRLRYLTRCYPVAVVVVESWGSNTLRNQPLKQECWNADIQLNLSRHSQSSLSQTPDSQDDKGNEQKQECRSFQVLATLERHPHRKCQQTTVEATSTSCLLEISSGRIRPASA